MNTPDIEGIQVILEEPKEKISLYDSGTKIQRISVVGLMRDCAEYVEYMLKVLDNMIKLYDVEFDFYFLENNSKDNTRELLVDWIDEKDGNVLLYDLKKDYNRTSHGIDFDRVSTLAFLRNKIKNNITPLDSDWVLMLDSNIYFDPKELQKFFACNPTKNNIGMMGAYTHQLHSPDILSRQVQEELNLPENKLISMHHYYDTYALIDEVGKTHFPQCPFDKCKICVNYSRGLNRRLIPEAQNIVDVKSCFGGLVMIQTDLYNREAIQWGTISYEPKMDLSLCEHVQFCDRINAITGKRIVILQNLDKVFRTN